MGITVKNNKPVTKNMTIKGDDGVGIKTITSGTPTITKEKTTTPITVTLTDETTQNFNVEAQNGSGGTGSKKYAHYLQLSTGVGTTLNIYINFIIFSNNANAYTNIEDLVSVLPSSFNVNATYGRVNNTVDKIIIYGVYQFRKFYFTFLPLTGPYALTEQYFDYDDFTVDNDTVVEI